MSLRTLFVAALAALGLGCAAWRGGGEFRDDFSSYEAGDCVPDGGRIGRWDVVSTGFGCVKAAGEGTRRWLHASTSRSESRSETHAVLITGPVMKAPFTLTARVNTVEQTRAGAANDWEAAWLVWGYTDRKHFYYFAAKPDGWELGKRDPAFRGGQRFLTDGKSPVFPLRTWARITITQTAEHHIIVRSGGRLVAAFTDVQRPYEAGKIGLYGEDCFARFDDVAAVSGEQELKPGDREDGGEQALDRGVRKAGASEVGARRSARERGGGQDGSDVGEAPRLDEVAGEARDGVDEDERGRYRRDRLRPLPAQEDPKRREEDPAAGPGQARQQAEAGAHPE